MITDLIKFLLKFIPESTLPEVSKEQELGVLSQLWQNDSFRRYSALRENYLIHQGMEDFIKGKLDNAHGLAGQLIEVRNLRIRAKSAYIVVDKMKKEASLTKEQK